MTRFARYLLLILWVLIATLGLTYLWIHELGRYVHLPDTFWVWVFAHTPGFWDGESAYDLAILIYLGISFVVVAIGTWAACRLARFRSLRRSNTSLRRH
jgi:hypothetical protein